MLEAESVIKYAAFIIRIIIIYEILRFIVKNKIIKKLTRSMHRYISDNNIQLDKFKFMNKFIIKHELLNDDDIHNAILAHARETGLNIQEVSDLVEDYIEEIVPFFSLLSYYKFGYSIANFFLNALYEVVIDHDNAKKIAKIPRNSAVVFVMNHRSNVDYILVAFMLARNISISYAVGEWARVWPLEYIFKSFGAYFLRRKYREQLYHLVLEKYIQMISRRGVTQGIFIEGGLTRDGKFKDTKIGLLDYILKVKNDPTFKDEIVFVPVGINYDWVLEDNVLIREWKTKKEKTGFRENVQSLVRLSFRGPFILLLNLLRYFTGNLKHHGYASVSFGDPVPVSNLLNKHTNFFTMERKKRLVLVKQFADDLQKKIGGVVPVTPVCLTSKAVRMIGKNSFHRDVLVSKIIEIVNELKGQNRRIVIGRAFRGYKDLYSRLQGEKKNRTRDLVSFEEDFLSVNEARNIMKIALNIFQRRGMVTVRKNMVHVNAKYQAYFEYYSNLLNYQESL